MYIAHKSLNLFPQQAAKSGGNTGRSRHSSITSTSTMRSNKQQVAGIGGSYAIETSFCGAKPLINPSTYDLSQHAQDEELGNQSSR